MSTTDREKFYRKRIAAKREELEAVNEQLGGTLSKRDEIKLDREAEKLIEEIEKLCKKIEAIEALQQEPLIQRPKKLAEEDWKSLFECFSPHDFADIQRAFLLGFKQVLKADFRQVRPDHPPLNKQSQIQDLLVKHDNLELAVRFAELTIVELQRSNEEKDRDLTGLEQWRDRIAQKHNVSLEDSEPLASATRQGYLLIALQVSGRQTQKDGAFVKVFTELHVTGESRPIEFGASSVTCPLSEVAEHLSNFIRKAEAALISYECSEVTLELFLPCIHLEENVSDWQVRNEQDRPRFLGKHRGFLVRSLERAMNQSTRMNLGEKWRVLENCVANKTVLKKFHCQEVCPNIGDLSALLSDKTGLRFLAELPDDREQRLDILYDIINSAVPIALWSSKFDSCTTAELEAQFNYLLTASQLTNFADLAQKWRIKRTESQDVAMEHIRLLCDCPDRWPSLPDPDQEDDLLAS